MISVGKWLDIVGASYCVASRTGQWQKAAINKQIHLGKMPNTYVFLCWLQTKVENYKGNKYTKKTPPFKHQIKIEILPPCFTTPKLRLRRCSFILTMARFTDSLIELSGFFWKPNNNRTREVVVICRKKSSIPRDRITLTPDPDGWIDGSCKCLLNACSQRKGGKGRTKIAGQFIRSKLYAWASRKRLG